MASKRGVDCFVFLMYKSNQVLYVSLPPNAWSVRGRVWKMLLCGVQRKERFWFGNSKEVFLVSEYSSVLASSMYISIADDGSAEAGMIKEDGNVLRVRLPVGETRNVSYSGNHSLTLERRGDEIVRKAVFCGFSCGKDSVFDKTTGGKVQWY